jgi:hypothetical protein
MGVGWNPKHKWRTGSLTRHARNYRILIEMEFERTEKEWAHTWYTSVKCNNDLEDDDLSDCYEDNNFVLAYDILGRRINKNQFSLDIQQII